MKIYPKTYEDAFTSALAFKRYKINKISNTDGIPIDKYISKFRCVFENQQLNTFDSLVKYVWLFKKFTFCGRKRSITDFRGNHYVFGMFLKEYVGYSKNSLGCPTIINKIIHYIFELFPDLDKRNPFEEKIEYPFKYMNFECLYFVYNLPEKLDLLKYGENEKMSYSQFMNYVINYVGCHNDEVGWEEYKVCKSFFHKIFYCIHIKKK